MKWDKPPLPRDQLLLISRSLDDAVPADHLVRVIELVLGALDWSGFTSQYHERLGQPAIPPQVLAAVILYGHVVGVRSSRRLEEALAVRVDFMWLAQGRQIDHSTLSGFRQRFAQQLASLGSQMAALAHQMGVTTLKCVHFDGTRLRANSGRGRSAAVDRLAEMEEKFRRKLQELEQQAQQQDAREDQQEALSPRVRQELADVRNRLAALQKAQAEIERARQAEEPIPQRVPLTDPEARIMPNKQGGFAPNYTPTAAVDAESGLILDAEVIAHTAEEECLVPALQRIEEGLAEQGLEVHVEQAVTDGKFVTGPNLEQLAQRKTELCAPIAQRPACVQREDGRVPIPAEQWDQLPKRRIKKARRDRPAQEQLTKEAFLYDAQANCYWCPLGQPLCFVGQTSEETRCHGRPRRVVRYRYAADPAACAGCPLRGQCVSARAQRRTLSSDQYEAHREAHRQRMASPECQERLKERCTEGERPFAGVKHRMGIRQFLLRGLERVRGEWRWITTAFNLRVMAGHVQTLGKALFGARSGPGPRAHQTRGSPAAVPAGA